MKHIGLFEGIGGFSLAARWMEWETIAWCEWNEFAQKVLKYHFPKAKPHGDITTTDFTIYRGQCDIITGGFPCQPYSTAGKRKGTADERHLWPEMLRAIREVQPSWVVGENVRGLINWNGGLVFDEVQADLENEGYEITPFLLPAVGINAPHRRDRIWFVAHSYSNGHSKKNAAGANRQASGTMQNEQEKRQWIRSESLGIMQTRYATDTQCIRQQGSRRTKRQMHSEKDSKWKASWTDDDGRWPTQPPVSNGNDGVSTRLDLTAISEKDWREESLKSGGNAIVPQVVFQIYKAIEQYESSQKQ